MEGKLKPLFPHYQSGKHFLLKNGSYIYGESKFTVEDYFLEEEAFRGVVPSDEANNKHQKHLIDVTLLMDSRSREGR